MSLSLAKLQAAKALYFVTTYLKMGGKGIQ